MRIPAVLQQSPPPESTARDAASAALHRPLPALMRTVYRTTNGVASEDGLVLYRCEDIAERNEAMEVARYAPEWIAIGDDSGGRVLLVNDDGVAVWVDVGSMDPRGGTPLNHDVIAWIESGARIEDSTPDFPAAVDVYLESAPTDGLKGLVRIKHGLNLQLGPAELKALLGQLPVRLLRGMPYGQALARCRKLNAVERCVGLRALDDPSRKVSAGEG